MCARVSHHNLLVDLKGHDDFFGYDDLTFDQEQISLAPVHRAFLPTINVVSKLSEVVSAVIQALLDFVFRRFPNRYIAVFIDIDFEVAHVVSFLQKSAQTVS